MSNLPEGFAMWIPTDVSRWPTGEPMRFIQHKAAFIDAMYKAGMIEELEKMTGPQREDEYFKWLELNPQPKTVITKNPDGTTTWELK